MSLLAFLNKIIGSHISHKKSHDRDAAEYDEKHVEIYNPTEQGRLRSVLREAMMSIRPRSDAPRVLDFGAGTGNLTNHLLELGANVVAADVSSKYLKQLRLKMGHYQRLETIILNGDNLSSVPDGSFDMVATYSVLHHVPDYLKIIDEFVRVLKAGGVVYIDHEACPTYWEEDSTYERYLEELGADFVRVHRDELVTTLHDGKNISGKSLHKSFFRPTNQGRSSRRKIRKGGDLHVFKDDHIMWKAVESRLHAQCEVLINSDYLVCRERDEDPAIWRKWQGRCSDMRILVARKM